ncbi:Acyl-CoA synthetase (AMP-forming)/AMP-acid ligase II [Myxococcus fulvus]|uniref:Acyl-CoA synthetase (AMP-forming)/AMP-acid ligase II n=1 Tax=Myxococcus fulvus TaxID=33 RepID=A0A511T8S1_MYXFU|nr:class I adenylate-forming enzyme family protein [Myxococcus fulvus]GEN09668.1 long-chain acyl-CoA synthetase [Myxococcus fulvus]SEU33594.1 Acyl-CoA synthetase (AMP-forming)/AMP-acid ligase II [Myxococcus fulvus]
MSATDSAPAWVLAHAQRTPSASAVDSPWTRLTYSQLAERMTALAGHLRSSGVSAGDKVLIALPLGSAGAVAGLAVQSLGACAVELDRETGATSVDAILAQTGARHAFVFGQDARKWTGKPGLTHVYVIHATRPPERMLQALAPATCTWVQEDGAVDPEAKASPLDALPSTPSDAHASIVYTSGSTGTPRGVIQTFGNIAANTRSIVEYLGLSSRDRAHLVLPLHYCYGKSVLQTHLLVGGSVFLDPRFMYPHVVLEAMAEERSTGFAGVPLTFELLKRQAGAEALSKLRLRYATQAGGGMSPDTIQWTREALYPAELYIMYGQTEATARLSYLPPTRAAEKAGSIGVAIPGVELRVVGEDGKALPTGETGHLVARGANVTPGYLGAPEETATILRDGWLWTGDMAWRDADGFIFLVGRAKEILKVGGHRVSPAELEHQLARHPSVREVAVVGVPDALGGEAACAVVVLQEGAAVEEDTLRRFCRESLPAHKVPRHVVFTDALPRGPSGKVLKAELRTQYSSIGSS